MANQIQKKERNISDEVLGKIKKMESAGSLDIPKDYSYENALKGAWLQLQETVDKSGKKVLETCSQASIATGLFKMVTEGLSVTKNQGYFIAYGGKLNFQKSYFGNLALAKRMCGVKDVNGVVIYEADKKDFKYQIDPDTGRKKVVSHIQKLENIDNNKIAGAYAIVIYSDGTTNMEIMTIKDIKLAWMQGAAKGNSPAHKNFPDQMAIKTVMNRAVKIALSSSDDSHLEIDRDTTDTEYKNEEGIETIEIPVTTETKEEVKMQNLEERKSNGKEQLVEIPENEEKEVKKEEPVF